MSSIEREESKQTQNSSNVFANTLVNDEIVISGIGGRYPESDSLDEFRDNLYNNVDMITSDDRRWPTDLYGMNHRMGKLKQIDKFDASFFGIVPKVADEVDPPGRILLETTWEAIVDAGVNPQSLRGTNTGVYVGYTAVAMPDGVPQEAQDDQQSSKVESLLWFQGGSKAFYANRISFLYDLHGPSMSIDVACASSMVCLDIAVTDLRLGKCDQAIVAGVSINLQPFTNHIYMINNIAAPDGRSKVWDQSANGYVRGETVCSLFLQKRSDSKRIYATVLHTKTNIDGYKITGMFFPSSESQYDLMRDTYTEAGIDPLEVNYFESHGTGTKAGDPQEARAILRARLPIGLLKSNIGHGEGASGVASISKLCIVYENKKIPANLNMQTIKSDIACMVPPLDPVTENRDYEPGIVGINSFGIGGVNAHALVKPNRKEFTDDSYKIIDSVPRLININGRTKESIEYIFDFIRDNPKRVTREFLALLGDTVNSEPTIYSGGFPYRGTMLIKTSPTSSNTYEFQTKLSKTDNVRRPICFFFSGMGSQWSSMAKSMISIEMFAESIQKCANFLRPMQIDLHHILTSDDPEALKEKIHHFVAITSVQIALVDLFRAYGIKPDYIIGHSFGEIACAYADGCLSLEQAIITSYWRGKSIKDANIEHGMMAAVGMSWEETKQKCPPNVYAACHNSIDSVTISGAYEPVNRFVKSLTEMKIFAKEVQCANIPFHSPLLNPAIKKMTEALRRVIPEPKPRSSKWISTSMPESEWLTEKAQRASADYFVNNLINPVYFHEGCQHLPENCIVIELASHTLFSAIFKRSMPKANYVGLMRRNNPDNLDYYLSSLGELYRLGVSIDLKPLYPSVQWPVPRDTQSISSLIQWDHSRSFLVKSYPKYHCQATAADFVQKFSLSNPDDQFLKDHAYDGQCYLPISCYLLLAWRRLGVSLGKLWYQFPVQFENVTFEPLIPISDENGCDEIELNVRILDPTDRFIILYHNQIIASGNIRCIECDGQNGQNDRSKFEYQDLLLNEFQLDQSCSLSGHKLDSNEFYTEMNVRGYDFGPKFKQIQQIEFANFNRSKALVRWDSNLITFVESMIQLSISHTEKRLIYTVSKISSFKCDPREFYSKSSDTLASVIIDTNLRLVISEGLEMKGLQFRHQPLRDVMKNVKMETYGFVPFDDRKAIDQDDYEQLQRYITDVQALYKTIEKVLCDEQTSSMILDGKIQKLIDRTEFNEREILMQILIQYLRCLIDENQNLRNVGEEKMKRSILKRILMTENNQDIHLDLLNSCHKNCRMMRSTLDVINENGLRNLTVIETVADGEIMIDDLVHHMSDHFHYPLVVDYHLVIENENRNKIPDSMRESVQQIYEWQISDGHKTTWPTIEKLSDLLVYRDCLQLNTNNLEELIQNFVLNMKENGFLLAIFRDRFYDFEQLIHDSLDKNEVDLKLSELGLQRIKSFIRLAESLGLSLISNKSDSLTSTCLLFRKKINDIKPEMQSIVPIYFGSFDKWVNKLKQTFIEKKSRPKNENIWLLADDSHFNGILGMINCLRQEPGGDRFRCIFSLNAPLPQPIDFKQNFYRKVLENDLAVNVWCDNQWGSYRLLDLHRNYNLRETLDAYLDFGIKDNSMQLKWHHLMSANASPSRKQIKVHINFSDLNDFHHRSDRFVDDQYENHSLGSGFSGYRFDDGEKVMGLAQSKTIASWIETDPNQLIAVPEEWTLVDGCATINALFMAWLGLVKRSQLKQDETILIHPGTNAKGLMAIQLAKRENCRIIATIENESQRQYLSENFGLSPANLISSRDTKFIDKILTLTSYKGVDVIFDSSSSELDLSLPILREHGRLIEIDRKFARKNPIHLKSTQHQINLSLMIDAKEFDSFVPPMMIEFREWFQDCAKKFIEPIDSKVFDIDNLDGAFDAMHQEDHIGKVILQIRNENNLSRKFSAIPTTRFSPKKCYVLVGGLGGLGLEVAHWMATRGARKLVLVSRSGIKNEYQYVFVKRIENLIRNTCEKANPEIKICTSDPSTIKGAEQLMNESQKLGPIGGIFHFATVLNDAFIEDQTPESFKKVCAPKMDALCCLDTITRQLCPELDYFVAFSSQSSSRGFIGQSNYGYANSVMEHICECRRNDGLPGQAIEYGPIGDVGLWAKNEHIDLTSIGMVIDTQRIPSCMEVLDRFLNRPEPIVATLFGIKTLNKMDHIWQGIGIELDSLPDNLTLGDVGMESILAVEMQQRIEREYEVNLGSDEIKNLTVGMIKEYRNADKDYICKSLLEFRDKTKQ
ncbi:Fatty acid synthase [Sarcoptes scabiei]|uniref:Fatty acid synthase n=1 Tax=Sarcoptes scabiei TaxID=52283 RepID=A0A834VFN2_SARSC|nr:Fatty acid synthase [Sarcoptes scabiei]